MISGVSVAIALSLAWVTLEATNFWITLDQQSKSIHVGSTMTTSAKVWISFLVKTMSTHRWEEWNIVEGNVCNCSHPTWRSTSRAKATKVSRTSSWVPMCSLPWVQHKKWTPITLMGCVHTHWRIPTIEGCGNPSHVRNIVKKDGEYNWKVGKVHWTIN
jgi:hypothetical protein